MSDPSYDDHLAQLEHWKEIDDEIELETCEWCMGVDRRCTWSEHVDMNICEECWGKSEFYGAVANNIRLLVKMATGEESQEFLSAQDVAETILEAIREKIEL